MCQEYIIVNFILEEAGVLRDPPPLSPPPKKKKTIKNKKQKNETKKTILQFHMKTSVCLKYLANDCRSHIKRPLELSDDFEWKKKSNELESVLVLIYRK